MVICLRTIKSVDERRQEILDGAVKLFSEKGYDKTSISDIATCLGISQGLCYRYFKSKEDIFKSAIDEYAKSIAYEMIEVITSSELTIEEKIKSQWDFQDLEKKKSSYYKVFHGEGTKHLHDSISISICRKVAPYVQAEINKEINNGRLEVIDSTMLTSCLVYGQLGILLDTNIDAKTRVKRISEFFTDMLERYKK